MRMGATYTYKPWIVAVAVVVGIVFAVGGILLASYIREEPKLATWRRIGAAILMGIAISGTHYTAMKAASVKRSSSDVRLQHTVHLSTLGALGISGVILVLLGVTVVSCVVDRQYDSQRLRLAEAEAKIEMAQATRLMLMGELTASIAHEIKQPLAAIVANGDYCLRQLAGASPNLKELHQAIKEIVEDGNRTSHIISRVRALLREESTERVSLDMNAIVGDVVRFVRNEIEQGRIALELALDEELPPVLGDRIQLQQALMNVVVNSIESLRSVAEPQRKMVIKSARRPEGVVVEVRDAGPGLEPAIGDRLFEPFLTNKPGGMGLGLSISRSIIESHHGRLSNLPTSFGAHFEFVLPAAQETS